MTGICRTEQNFLSGCWDFSINLSPIVRAKEANIDNTTLKNIMQHSSLNTTELYMKKLDRRTEDEAMKQIYLDKNQHNRKKRRIVRQIKKLGISTQELMELLAGE